MGLGEKPQLGNVPNLNNLAIFPQAQTNPVTDVNNAITETNTQDEKQNSQSSKLTLIYYDSRSGSRYLLNDGKKEKLSESGVVVINETSRPETTNKARSTFFAVSSNK